MPQMRRCPHCFEVLHGRRGSLHYSAHHGRRSLGYIFVAVCPKCGEPVPITRAEYEALIAHPPTWEEIQAAAASLDDRPRQRDSVDSLAAG